MVSKISEGVQITVETFYNPDHSSSTTKEYMFAYRILIENQNDFPIRLISRHWYITDSNNSKREVKGEGVVGVQPVIHPGQSYQYVSGCNFRTEIGKMSGVYQMENLSNNRSFEVKIPAFVMVAPFKNN